MTSIIQRYLTRSLLQVVAACVIGLCGPVILVSLITRVPASALSSGLLVDAVYGITPTALYLTMPMAVGLGLTWSYARLAADGTLAILYATRLSVFTVCRPAIIIALAATMICYALSCLVAPSSVTHIHDVLFLIRNNLSSRLLQPGQFYDIGDGRTTIYFSRRIDRHQIGGVVVRDLTQEGSERVIVARQADFEGQTESRERLIVFHEGTLQTKSALTEELKTVVFSTLDWPLLQEGSPVNQQRSWRGLFEMSTKGFLAARYDIADHRQAKQWASEALKRFGLPAMALGHALLGLALVLAFGGLSGRGGLRGTLCCAAIPLLHMGFLFGAEGAVYYDERLAWVIGMVIPGEFAVALILLRLASAPISIPRHMLRLTGRSVIPPSARAA